MLAHALSDPSEFLDRIAPLVADEARSNLPLGITRTIMSFPEVYPEYRLFLVEHPDRLVAACLITPPHHVPILSVAERTSPEATVPLQPS